jgi:hypothetical protein
VTTCILICSLQITPKWTRYYFNDYQLMCATVSVFAFLKCVALAFAGVLLCISFIFYCRSGWSGIMLTIHWDVNRLCGPCWGGGNGDTEPLPLHWHSFWQHAVGIRRAAGPELDLLTIITTGIEWATMYKHALRCGVEIDGLLPLRGHRAPVLLPSSRQCCQVVMQLHNESLHEITCYYMHWHVIPSSCNSL